MSIADPGRADIDALVATPDAVQVGGYDRGLVYYRRLATQDDVEAPQIGPACVVLSAPLREDLEPGREAVILDRSRLWGCGPLLMVYLLPFVGLTAHNARTFPLRAPSEASMEVRWTHSVATGVAKAVHDRGGIVVAAWGADASRPTAYRSRRADPARAGVAEDFQLAMALHKIPIRAQGLTAKGFPLSPVNWRWPTLPEIWKDGWKS